MKISSKRPLFAIIPALMMALMFQGCLKDTCQSTQTYIRYVPLYKTPTAIRSEGIKLSAARDLKFPGKIYYYQQYLLVNEQHEGIHIFDNSNPASPRNLGFLSIPGNVDMAIKGNVLYADNYIDLLAIDITNPAQATLLKRREDVFPPISKDPVKGYLVGYQQEKVQAPCNSPITFYDNEVFLIRSDVAGSVSKGGALPNWGGATAPTGIGGSMARFTLYDNYLYTVDQTTLRVFNIATLANPVLINSINLGWGIETIFPYNNRLFIGSNTGMFIFDNSNPSNPVQLSRFQHAMACDPVYATDTRAYVTLRRGTNCFRATDQLDVVDITDLKSPKLLRSYAMFNPRGLSVLNKTLYLCDDGLKVFDVSDDYTIDDHKLSHITGLDTYDVITLEDEKLAVVVGANGLYQYDISNPAKLKSISLIPVKQ